MVVRRSAPGLDLVRAPVPPGNPWIRHGVRPVVVGGVSATGPGRSYRRIATSRVPVAHQSRARTGSGRWTLVPGRDAGATGRRLGVSVGVAFRPTPRASSHPRGTGHLLQLRCRCVDPLDTRGLAVPVDGEHVLQRTPRAGGRMAGAPAQDDVAVGEHHSEGDDADARDTCVIDVPDEGEPAGEHDRHHGPLGRRATRPGTARSGRITGVILVHDRTPVTVPRRSASGPGSCRPRSADGQDPHNVSNALWMSTSPFTSTWIWGPPSRLNQRGKT